MTSQNIHLEDRFLEPYGWRWHHFKREGRKLRFGSAFPKDSIPDAIVVCLPGLSEFGEKYYEFASEMLAKNYAFWVLDWYGQGGSERHLKDPLKRYSFGFDHDVDDLHAWILGYIKHSSVHPDRGRIPMVMLAHSMGGNIGLQYLHKYPGVFECAAFSAPMIGIYVLRNLPKPLALLVGATMNLLAGKMFTSPDGKFSERQHQQFENNPLTSDRARFDLTEKWFTLSEKLRVGDVTYGWVYQALKACIKVQDPKFLKSIQTPCLIALAEKETIVDNNAARKSASHLSRSTLIEIKDSQHEILMESDICRAQFVECFHALIKERIIDRPETLKPF